MSQPLSSLAKDNLPKEGHERINCPLTRLHTPLYIKEQRGKPLGTLRMPYEYDEMAYHKEFEANKPDPALLNSSSKMSDRVQAIWDSIPLRTDHLHE